MPLRISILVLYSGSRLPDPGKRSPHPCLPRGKAPASPPSEGGAGGGWLFFPGFGIRDSGPYSSPNFPSMSFESASTAWSASSPSARRVSRVPATAASVSRSIEDFAFTVWPSFTTLTRDLNLAAVPANSAEGRTWSPSVLRIVTWRSASIGVSDGLNRHFLDFAEDLFDVLGRLRAFEKLHEIRLLERGHDLLKRLEVGLALRGGRQDQEDEADLLAVDGVEFHRGGRPAEGADDVLDSFELGVGNAHAA